jgi:predicted DCC family thiol-disulfide oxidoreductase YuxK
VAEIARQSDPASSKYVLFDGACGVCTRSVRFIARRDVHKRFWFVPIGSAAAARVLKASGHAAPPAETMALLDGGRLSIRSEAVLRIARELGWPWRLASVLLAVPGPLRDGVYRLVARNRRRVFKQTCRLDDAAIRSRVLED